MKKKIYDRNACLFCKIADKKVVSDVIFENKDFFAFRDIRPIKKNHILLIPKLHIPTLSDCKKTNTELLGKMLLLINDIAKNLGISYNGEENTGFRVIINVGPNAGQEVYHLHIHILSDN